MTGEKAARATQDAGGRLRGRGRDRGTPHQQFAQPGLRRPPTGTVTPAHLVALQRLAGNRVAQRFVGGRLAEQIAAAGTGRRVQRVTSCTDWWQAQPNAAGREISQAGVQAYWASIATQRSTYVPIAVKEVLAGATTPAAGRANLDEYAGVLTWCEGFWRDTQADRDAAHVSDEFVDLVDGIGWRDIRDADFLTERAAIWAELARESTQAGAMKVQLHNSCTEELLTKHIIGRTGPVSDEEAWAKALQTADSRSANESTLINLSGNYLASFEREVDGARTDKRTTLRTEGFYPVIHVEGRAKVQKGLASVNLTRESGPLKVDKKFNHFSPPLTWSGTEPKPTDRKGAEIAESGGTGGKGTRKGK